MFAQLHCTQYGILVRVVPLHADNGIRMKRGQVHGHGQIALQDAGTLNRAASRQIGLHFFDLGKCFSQAAGFLKIQGAVNVLGAAVHSDAAALGIGTTVIAGICGSASGGLGIAVPILGPVYTQLGIAPSIVHRVMALSSSALDSLPHNGYIVTVTNGLCNETHKDSYGLTFALTVVIPFLGSLVGVLLFTIFPNLP